MQTPLETLAFDPQKAVCAKKPALACCHQRRWKPLSPRAAPERDCAGAQVLSSGSAWSGGGDEWQAGKVIIVYL